MGRHADPTAPRRNAPLPLLIAAGVVVLLVAGGLVWWLTGSETCEVRETVDVTVAPELGPLAEDLLAEPVELDGGLCASAEVTAQQPLQTVGDLAALEGEALPDVWVPDSSLWAARAGSAALEPVGSLASSPVVLATSRDAVEALGWAEEAPGWAAALAGEQALAVPDLATSAEGLAALAAVRGALGGGEDADNAVVQAVLAAQRGPAVSAADGLASGRDGGADAPLVPVSEQEVYETNQEAEGSALTAVYPAEGSPWLDYPVLRVGSPSGDAAAAVEAIVERLTSDAARAAALDAGFRDPDGSAPADADEAGIQQEAPAEVELDPAAVQALLARLSSLASPSRILAAFDVSTSMEAPVGDGTRATLARDAAKATLSLVPGDYALGLWAFAYQLENGQDWTSLVPTRELDAAVDGRSQREILDSQLDTIPDRLTPGGTGLYDTTLAAVRAARSDYDPTAVNSVLVLTDGTNEDDEGGISLENLLITLAAEANPERPVKVIGVALGPDADLAALEQIAEATGGEAYSAVDPADLQTVLFDALRQRG
ncbi:substrate-binding domain-containing protein [Blastococcus tunisiensis]|uniref:von Willebrand factor type A domain-containing protein n=1 Tax=Blastococcus tunisiensis TaxID=1798228 RepID=A0A1I1XJ75_9ACTN|nr:substrate-binding domain-containing protein [Blastococcus sp. DSM 46838]SFE05440.1 von Willebrand factor type A domain-containing protein [Blastococcus sp. DSM 46838]